jgi:capsular polysaccharide export protein
LKLVDQLKREKRKFVFLQGPHGPFFYEISRILIDAGVEVQKIGFNKGDEKFWPDKKTYTAYKGMPENWLAYFSDMVAAGITDVVLYGDSRGIHAEVIKFVSNKNIKIHCFEEGYLRPYWATYERGGVNGNSRLVDMTLEQMRVAISSLDDEQPEVPAKWGELRRHTWYGAKYHWHVFFGSRSYPNYKTHRKYSVRQEFWSHAKRLLLMPYRWAERIVETKKITNKGYVYHLALLQLSHDSSIIDHSKYAKHA